MRERLQHIAAAGTTILNAIEGKSFDEYESNTLLKWGIERAFTIIGEALREASKSDPDLTTSISGYRRIIDFRNVLVHGYATVYDEGVWRIIEEHPVLLAEVDALLSEGDPE